MTATASLAAMSGMALPASLIALVVGLGVAPALASRLEVVVDAPPYPSHGAFCRSRAVDRLYASMLQCAHAEANGSAP